MEEEYKSKIYPAPVVWTAIEFVAQFAKKYCTFRFPNAHVLLDPAAASLRTPLQIEQHLTLAFETAYQLGEKPVTRAIVESILSKQIDDLEPTLTRHGYSVKTLSEQFGAKPAEIRSLFRNQLEPARALELQQQMLAAGLPL